MSAASVELRVRNLADLEALVCHPDREYRLAACSSIVQAPEKAVELASDTGRDVVDLLLAAFPRTRSAPERVALLEALSALPCDRVREFLRRLLVSDSADDLLHAAARCYDAVRDGPDVSFLVALLRDDDSLSRIRIAAARLAPCELRDTADRIRMAAFSVGRVEFPAVTTQTLPAWREQLAGPVAEYLLLTLESNGPGVAEWAGVWEHLDTWFRHWLLRRACCASPAVETVIRLGLNAEDEDTVAAARNAVLLYRPQLGAETLAALSLGELPGR